MTDAQTLHYLLEKAAHRWPEQTAVVEPEGDQITYHQLNGLSDRLRDRLVGLGVQPGDRVGIWLPKSIDGVAAIFGILKAGAAYVPVDPGAPPDRNAFIFGNCAVQAVVVEQPFAEALLAELAGLDLSPAVIVVGRAGGGAGLAAVLDEQQAQDPVSPADATAVGADDLAYILYTSGSTGRPKGVMLTHGNARNFIDWCSGEFRPTEQDRFSSHAPFHFDLSIFDLYVCLKHGATLVLIGESLGKSPLKLAGVIAEQRLTVWYSTPSILTFLQQYGKLDDYDFSALRLVLFAGEVFPVKHLRALLAAWPGPRYYNLYGPTETNVCTYYEIPAEIPPERSQPFPIGRVCPPLETRVVDPAGRPVAAGEEGELCVAGPGVMQGYWNRPERNAQAFLVDETGRRWYKTGDIVVEEVDGNYTFVGRRDRMIKKRGYRIELGEIEAGLYRHPEVKEAAVIPVVHEEQGVQIRAFLSCHGGGKLSVIALKRFCAEVLPDYMIPDFFSFEPTLPKTSTDKIDYQRLKEMAR